MSVNVGMMASRFPFFLTSSGHGSHSTTPPAHNSGSAGAHAERNDRKQRLGRRHACGPQMPHAHHHLWLGRAIRRLLLTFTLPALLAPGNLPYVVSQVPCELVILTAAAFFLQVQSPSRDRAHPRILSRSPCATRRPDRVERQIRHDADLCPASGIQRSWSRDDGALADFPQCRFHSGGWIIAHRHRPSGSRTSDRRFAKLLHRRRGGHSRAAQASRSCDFDIEHIASRTRPAHPPASPYGHPRQNRQSISFPHALRGPILLVRR